MSSTFWHQGLQNNLRGTSRWITSDFLGITSYTLATRYSKIFFAFFLSGVLHVSSDMGSGVSYGKSGAIRFFCTQEIGYMIEDAAIGFYGKIFGDGKHSKAAKYFLKVLGYFWVLAFLVWSIPVRWFPIIQMQKRETEMVGLDAFHPLAKAFQ